MISISQEEIMQNWSIKNTETPLVSVRCITYNHEPYIAQTIDGFLMQKTNFPYEVVIHDDASTDRTAEIIREYEKKYPLIIKPIYQTENQYSKGNGSVSKAIDPKLKGKYIAFCEGDDYWIDPNKLQMQVDFLEKNPEYGMCYTNCNIFNQRNGYIRYSVLPTHIYTLDEWVIKAGYVAPLTWVFQKKLYDNYKPILFSKDGTFVMFAYFLSVTKVKYFANIPSGVYRVLEDSASHSTDLNKVLMRNKNIYEVQCELITRYNLDDSIKKVCERKYYIHSFFLFAALGMKNEIKKSLTYCKSPLHIFLAIFVTCRFNRKIFFMLYTKYRIKKDFSIIRC